MNHREYGIGKADRLGRKARSERRLFVLHAKAARNAAKIENRKIKEQRAL